MQHYTSKSTEMEGAFRPLADLGAKIEQIEAQLASEGMPEEIEPTPDADSLDGRLALVAADTDATEEMAHYYYSADDGPEDDTYSPARSEQEQSEPTPAEREILDRLKELGWATHPALLAECGASTEQLAKLSSLGLAHMRATSSGERVFAMAGATEDDVERAGEWVAAQRREALRTAMQSRAHQISRAITARLERLGGACSEEALYGSLLGTHPREAVDAVIMHMGSAGGLRRVRIQRSPHTLLALPGASKEQIRAASRKLQELSRDAHQRRDALRNNTTEARKRRGRRTPAMRLAETISEGSSHGEYDDRPEAASVLRAAPHHFWAIWESFRERVPAMDYEQARQLLDSLPFKSTLEAAGWESESARKKRYANRLRMRKECTARRREGRPLFVVPARELDERLASPAKSIAARKRIRRERLRALFRNSRRSRSPERIALDTARAVVLRDTGTQGGKLLAALAKAPLATCAGKLTLGCFVPIGLTGEGRAIMSRRLLAVLADPKNGIRLPEDLKLARKVEAFRHSQANSEAWLSASRAAPERAKACVAGAAA